MKDTLLQDIFKAQQTVFTMRELLLIWGKADVHLLRSRVSYYHKKGYLIRLRRGLYAKTEEYNTFEVASKLMNPSYVSFETVLVQAGVIFQYYEQIFSASYQTRSIECDKKTYTYRQLKGPILTNTQGVINKEFYNIATPERAFLDMVYLHSAYYFDNLSALNWPTIMKLLPLYNNKLMEKRVDRYYKTYKESEHGT